MIDADEEELDGERGGPRVPLTSAAVGLVAMAPLLLAYEWSVRAGGQRSAAEALLSRPLAPLGEAGETARLLLVLVGIAAAALLVELRGGRLRPALARTLGEGLLAAMVLGPALWYLTAALPGGAPTGGLRTAPHAQHADLVHTAAVFGGAAWEELLFRLLLYGLLYLVVRRALLGLGVASAASSGAADVFALVLSSLAFAAAHLDVVVAFVGPGGEAFDPGRFAWRALGGALLALLFRWRGLGVAAWAHGLFNAALLLGVGPGVLS